MFAATVLNYMDRQAIALVSPHIRRQYGIDFEGFGWLLTAFGLSYALFQVPAGFLADRFDVRRLYPAAVAFWSIAAMACSIAPTLGVLILLRAMLGMGESFNWPCALRVTGKILPPRDRSLGNGIFNSGAAIGAVLTPLTVPALTYWFGWQIAFVVIGILGFLWVGVWLITTRRLPDLSHRGERTSTLSEGTASKRRIDPIGWTALGLVGLAALGVVSNGWLRQVKLPVEANRVRPNGLVELVGWKVADGQSVKRGAPVAAMKLGNVELLMLSPDEGRVEARNVKAGDPVSAGQTIADLVDSVGPRPLAFTSLKSSAAGTLTRWLVQPGDLVSTGQPIAEARLGDQEVLLEAGESGRMDEVLQIEANQPFEPGKSIGTLVVQGFHPRADGLPGVWLAVATLMIGLLLVTRLVDLNHLGTGWARSLGEIVRLRQFWILVLVSATINVCWHFLINWLPTYLQTDRAMTFLSGGLWSALPFLAADVGNLAGGATSRRLANMGLPPARARLIVMSGCAVLVSLGALVGWMPAGPAGQFGVLCLLALMALGAAAYMANYFAFCQAVSPRHIGLIVGYLGGLGNLFAAGFSPVAGRIKDTSGDFSLVFLMVGLVPFLGLAALWLGWGTSVDDDAEPNAAL